MPNAAEISTGASEFGKTCRRMIREFLKTKWRMQQTQIPYFESEETHRVYIGRSLAQLVTPIRIHNEPHRTLLNHRYNSDDEKKCW